MGLGGVIAASNTPGELFPLTAGTVLGSGGGVLGSAGGLLFKLTSGIYPTTVQSSANPVSYTQPVTLAGNVTTPIEGAIVTFKDGAATLGNAAVAYGTATLTVSLAPGVHKITAINDADNLVSPPYFQLVKGQ